MDGLVLIALIVVSVIVGKPVSYLDCRALGGGALSSTLAFTTQLSSMLDGVGGKVEYENWIGASKAICLETKAIWGLCIALWYVLPFHLLDFGDCGADCGAVFCSSSRASRPRFSGGGRRLLGGIN
jgi:hypothetical protein